MVRTRTSLTCILALALLGTQADAQSVSMRYASSVVPGPVPPSRPSAGLGRPNGTLSSFNDIGAEATYFGFDCVAVWNEAALASTLGVAPSVFAQADFIYFEFNGAPGQGLESTVWTFMDSNDTEIKNIVNGVPGDELASGGVGTTPYASFFGGTSPHGGQWVFALFEFNTVDPFDPAFQVHLQRGGGGFDSPDLDFMATITRDAAVTAPRNGGGTNPNGFSEIAPAIIGNNWTTVVDIATPGAPLSVVAVSAIGGTQGTILTGAIHGELLALPPFLPLDISLTGQHSIPIPNNCTLVRTLLFTQAATYKPADIQLQNAIDIAIGAY